MDLNWIWQGIVTNWIADLLILGGGILIAILKVKGSRWLMPLAYGLAGSALIGVILFTIMGLAELRSRERVTVDNVATKVRSWIDNFQLSVRTNPLPEAYFRYEVTMRNGNVVVVARPKERDRYIVIAGRLVSDAPTIETLSHLSVDQRQELLADMIAEMARSKVTFSNMQVPPQNIVLEHRLPISDSLTEAVLLGAIDDMDSAMALIQATVAKAIPQYHLTENPRRASQ